MGNATHTWFDNPSKPGWYWCGFLREIVYVDTYTRVLRAGHGASNLVSFYNSRWTPIEVPNGK